MALATIGQAIVARHYAFAALLHPIHKTDRDNRFSVFFLCTIAPAMNSPSATNTRAVLEYGIRVSASLISLLICSTAKRDSSFDFISGLTGACFFGSCDVGFCLFPNAFPVSTIGGIVSWPRSPQVEAWPPQTKYQCFRQNRCSQRWSIRSWPTGGTDSPFHLALG